MVYLTWRVHAYLTPVWVFLAGLFVCVCKHVPDNGVVVVEQARVFGGQPMRRMCACVTNDLVYLACVHKYLTMALFLSGTLRHTPYIRNP